MTTAGWASTSAPTGRPRTTAPATTTPARTRSRTARRSTRSRRLEVEWELETQQDATYRLEFFVSDACDPSGSGEAQTHVETIQVDTDANGDADDTTAIAAAVGQQVTMTATKLGADDVPRSTSELSPCEEVQ